MKKQSFIRIMVPVALSAFALTATATEKVLQIFRDGKVISEYKVADIDYVEVNDAIDVPEEISATVEDRSITITWSEVSGATYSVYRSADNEHFQRLVSGLTVTTYTDNDPLAGICYYKVKAKVGDMEGDFTAVAAGAFVKDADSMVESAYDYMKVPIWSSHSYLQNDFAYPSMMIARDVMCQDMIQTHSGYEHFFYWQDVTINLNKNYPVNQTTWNYYNLQVQKINAVIGQIDSATAGTADLNRLGQVLALRALIYLDMARMYEFLSNSVTSPITSDGNNVLGLTVPIRTDLRHPSDSTNTPRASHKEMLTFILSDLDSAESYFKADNSRPDKSRPDLSVVYGLKARAYMWDENYQKAAEYARFAQEGYTPLTKEQWIDPVKGFNSMDNDSWMFAIHQCKEDSCVQSIANWTSFMSSEGFVGFNGSGYGTYIYSPMKADVSFYNRIDDGDFRKLSWRAPRGSALESDNVYAFGESDKIRDYVSLKFRNGGGNADDQSIKWATDIPLMRVEEMYLIEAEAIAQTDADAGRQKLVEFMTRYRNPDYTFTSSNKGEVIDEIFFQKRVELWGEGLIFFDFKRLNKGVTRMYNGSNWPTAQYNTVGRPAWMNLVMCRSEEDLNPACKGWNNPNVGGLGAY